MHEIAKTFSNSPKYRETAQKFRLPFWDYFRPRGNDAIFPGITGPNGTAKFDYDFSIPQILTLQKVMIRVPPNDDIKLEHNPLRTFWFPVKGGIKERDWSNLRLLVRL